MEAQNNETSVDQKLASEQSDTVLHPAPPLATTSANDSSGWGWMPSISSLSSYFFPSSTSTSPSLTATQIPSLQTPQQQDEIDPVEQKQQNESAQQQAEATNLNALGIASVPIPTPEVASPPHPGEQFPLEAELAAIQHQETQEQQAEPAQQQSTNDASPSKNDASVADDIKLALEEQSLVVHLLPGNIPTPLTTSGDTADNQELPSESDTDEGDDSDIVDEELGTINTLQAPTDEQEEIAKQLAQQLQLEQQLRLKAQEEETARQLAQQQLQEKIERERKTQEEAEARIKEQQAEAARVREQQAQAAMLLQQQQAAAAVLAQQQAAEVARQNEIASIIAAGTAAGF